MKRHYKHSGSPVRFTAYQAIPHPAGCLSRSADSRRPDKFFHCMSTWDRICRTVVAKLSPIGAKLIAGGRRIEIIAGIGVAVETRASLRGSRRWLV